MFAEAVGKKLLITLGFRFQSTLMEFPGEHRREEGPLNLAGSIAGLRPGCGCLIPCKSEALAPERDMHTNDTIVSLNTFQCPAAKSHLVVSFLQYEVQKVACA